MRTCSICHHTDRTAIDKALVSGTPFRTVVGAHHVSLGALSRHREKCIPAVVKATREAERRAAELEHVQVVAIRGRSTLEQIADLQDRAIRILDDAESKGRHVSAVAAIREARECLLLGAKLTGELDERPQVNVAVGMVPDFVRLREVIHDVLRKYPGAWEELTGRLGEVDAA